MPELIIQERGREEPFVHTCAEDVISIGRQDSNTIQLRSKGVSRRHAQISMDGENCFITDLGSGNGTFLNGMRLRPEDKSLLRPGDRIAIDVYDIRFHQGGVTEAELSQEEITGSDILEVKLLKKVLTALDKETVPSLEVLNGSAEGKKLYLTDELNEFAIGRDPDCEFPINEYVISRRHSQIIKRWGGIAIRDLESKNGTFVNNRRVVEEYLHDGDRVALGTIVFLFRNPQEINLAHLEDIQPKTRPAPVNPDEIPGIEEAPTEASEEPQLVEEQAAEEPTGEEEQGEALEQWEQLQQTTPQGYPTPHHHVEAIKRFSPIEIGMIGLGVLVLIFALITIVNLLSA